MNREDAFWRTIDVLAQAYMNAELKHGDSRCCAIGVMEKAGGTARFSPHRFKRKFMNYFMKGRISYWVTDGLPDWPYSDREVAVIEAAFEDRCRSIVPTLGEISPDYGFYDTGDPRLDGVLRVVDVLMELHDVDDDELRANVQEALTKRDRDALKV